MRGGTHGPLTPPPRRWCTGVALAAAVVAAAAVASGALAQSGAPTDTTPTPTVTTPDPSVTVTVPDPEPAPVEVVPKPDPGPVKVAPKPRPHIVHRTAPVTPAVVHPVYLPPTTPSVVVRPTVAKPRLTPKHVATRRKHLVTPKQPTAPRVAKPKPKPKPPTIALLNESTRNGGGWASTAWAKVALVGAFAFLLFPTVLLAMRRRSRPSTDVAPSSANGSRPALRDEELASLELELRTHAERADELAAELAPFRARDEVIPDSLLIAEKTANELRDSASATLLKARRLADRIVEEAARRRTRLEARNASLQLELKARAERADELAAELAQFHAREELIRETLVTAQQTANELRDSASATLRKARSRADRIVEEAERRRMLLEAEFQGLERLAVEDRAEVATLLQSLLEQVAGPGEPGSLGGQRAPQPLPESQGERFNSGDDVRLTEPTLGMREGVPRELWEVPTSEIGQVVDHTSGENGSHPIRLVVEAERLEGAEQPAPADPSIAS